MLITDKFEKGYLFNRLQYNTQSTWNQDRDGVFFSTIHSDLWSNNNFLLCSSIICKSYADISPPLPSYYQTGRGWSPCGTAPGDRTSLRITDVEPGKEYLFRVVAENKAGPSEPSDPSDSVICKPRFCEYLLSLLKQWLLNENWLFC